MNDDPHSDQKSWLYRLAQTLHREPHNRDELIELLHNAKERQLLDNDALSMIEGVLDVSLTHVRDIMVPRGQMVIVDFDETPEKTVSLVIDSTHSRFPVIGENRDEVLGILLAKDLLKYFNQNQTKPTCVKELIRPAVFVPESKRIDILLREFRINRYHMAIVVDEYGGVSGLVTIEDVLEQIVGNIEDETDITVDEPNIRLNTDKSYEIKALTPIDEFNQYFSQSIDDDDFDTIGGFIMQQIGHMPKKGETLDLPEFTITVLSASKRRLKQLRLNKK